ncbi:lipid droplet assembly factor 1-A [Electrophorus electricus]|uniref:lipid droplet assembly factor 1-A n=1 Tax=Electrophorus electricus TaxID=8005 RepID=UPI000F09B988|nr:lipid droplet assembly factor 1-A [Electrophorus electricus]
MMDDMNCEPMIAELLNTKFGKYLSDHPFFALVLLVFGVIASVPIGLFLVFAVVTFVAVTVFFVFVEIFLLTAGGATLLCVLCCIAVVTFSVSCILSALYIITSHVLNNCFLLRVYEQTVSTEDMETKKEQKPVW